MTTKSLELRARGVSQNPPNRFENHRYDPDPEYLEIRKPVVPTEIFPDHSRSIIAFNDSPDVGFDASINPYRGCEHGCVYCYARPSHEYLGFSSGLDFETKIMVKEDAPELLEKELSYPKWRPQVIAVSGNTDAYQPVERNFELTRRCLQVLEKFRNPAVIVTKSNLVCRDTELLKDLSAFNGIAVFISITTLNEKLARKLEPRAPHPSVRLETVRTLANAGIPTGVLVAPVIPGLTDHEMSAIITASVQAGAQFAGYVVLRLPYAIKDIFETWMVKNFPHRKNKVLNRVREMRNGNLNDSRFRIRMKGEGVFSDQINALFTTSCKKMGILGNFPNLSTRDFRNPKNQQLQLFSK